MRRLVGRQADGNNRTKGPTRKPDVCGTPVHLLTWRPDYPSGIPKPSQKVGHPPGAWEGEKPAPFTKAVKDAPPENSNQPRRVRHPPILLRSGRLAITPREPIGPASAYPAVREDLGVRGCATRRL